MSIVLKDNWICSSEYEDLPKVVSLELNQSEKESLIKATSVLIHHQEFQEIIVPVSNWETNEDYKGKARSGLLRIQRDGLVFQFINEYTHSTMVHRILNHKEVIATIVAEIVPKFQEQVEDAVVTDSDKTVLTLLIGGVKFDSVGILKALDKQTLKVVSVIGVHLEGKVIPIATIEESFATFEVVLHHGQDDPKKFH